MERKKRTSAKPRVTRKKKLTAKPTVTSGRHKGKSYLISQGPSGSTLSIAEKSVEIGVDSDSGRCSTERLPYEDFESTADLAKALIDRKLV